MTGPPVVPVEKKKIEQRRGGWGGQVRNKDVKEGGNDLMKERK